MEGHHEQENTLNQLLVEMDGKSRQGSTKCTPESSMCKKYSTQHKMYAREFHVQKVPCWSHLLMLCMDPKLRFCMDMYMSIYRFCTVYNVHYIQV